MKIALSVSYPAPPSDDKDKWRIECYLDAIRIGGGEPTVLFLDEWETKAAEVAREFGGLVLSGGADLPTDWYGQEPLEGAGLELVSPRRPEFERQLVGEFLAAKKPILGICYGLQFLNVVRGGALFQDLKLQTGAIYPHENGELHPVRLARDSQLFGIIGEEEFAVPSFHHQAVSVVAPGGRAVAWADDGTIEAVEWAGESWFLGVQWHPERAADSDATKRLVGAFVGACG